MEQEKVDLDYKRIGQKLREERERLNLSRGQLAEIIGLSDYYVGQLERGERRMSLQVLIKIAACLHISLDSLVLGKNTCYHSYVNDDSKNYDRTSNKTWNEIQALLNKCSPQELVLVKKLLETILPYLHS